MTYSFDWIEGFEDQVLTDLQFGSSDGIGVWDAVITPANMTFVAGRTGGSAIHIDDSSVGTATHIDKWLPLTQQRVFSGYFRAASAPSVESSIWSIFDNAGALIARVRLEAAGTARAGCIDGVAHSSAGNVCDNAWHRLDVIVDSTAGAGTWNIQWSIDGVAQTGSTSSAGKSATNQRRLALGSAVAANTEVVDWDDCVSSPVAADYPIGAHHVNTLPPVADGVNNAGSHIIEDQNGNTIGTQPAWSLMEEMPPTLTEYVRQNVSGATNYAEVTFDPNPATGGELLAGVMAFSGGFASTTVVETGNPTARVIGSTGTTLVDIFSGTMNATVLRYNSVMVPAPGGTWSSSEFDGLKVRVGFRSDAVGGHPRWSAVWLAVVILEPVTSTDTQTATAIVSKRLTKTHTSDARIGNPVFSQSHTSDGVIRKTGLLRQHSTDAEITGGIVRRVNTFEGGANGVTITTSNSGGGSGNAFQDVAVGVNTVVYDSATAGHGNVSARLVPGTTTCYCAYTTGIGTQTSIYGRVYVRLAALPNAFITLVSLLPPTGIATDRCAAIDIESNGRIRVMDTNLTQQGITPNTVAGKVPVGAWCRIEWHATGSPTTGSVEVKLFLTPTSLTPDTTLTVTAIDTRGPMGKYRIGKNNGSAVAEATFNMDEIGWDTAGYLGPATDTSTKTQTVTAIVRKLTTKTHLSNAIVTRTFPLTHTSDASILLQPHPLHTSDAILAKTVPVTHTSDAYIHGVHTAIHNTDAYIAGGFIPAANSWLVVDVTSTKTTGSVPIPTVTDTLGTTFTREATIVGAGVADRLSRFYARVGANPLPRSILVSFGGDVQGRVLVEVMQIQGVDSSDPFVDTIPASFTAADTGIALTVPPYASVANRGLFAVTHPVDEVSNNEAGWTELADLHAATAALAVAWSDAEDDTPTYTWATSTTGIIGIHSEIQVLHTGYVQQTADAIIRKALSRSHTSDAVVRKPTLKAHTSDAIIVGSRRSVSHGSDAFLTKTPGTTHRTDAVLAKTGSRSHISDAVIAELPAPPPINLGPGHRLALAYRSTSGLGGEIISDILAATGTLDSFRLTYEDELNASGRLEFSLPIDHALVTRDNFAVREREIHLYRGDAEELVWAGTLEAAQVRGWEVRFIAIGWYDGLARRTIKQDYSSRSTFDPQTGWTYLDQFQIVRELVTLAQAENSLGLTFYDPSAFTGVTRRLTVCAEERRLISDVIEEFAAASNGFDYAVTPDKQLRMWFPRRDSLQPVLTVDGTSTFSEVEYTIDGQDIITQVSGIGPTDECGTPDIDMLPTNPLSDLAVQRYGTLDGTVDLQHNWDDEHRLAVVNEALQEGNHPRFQTTVTVPTQLPGIVDPSAYSIGDQITVVASRGAVGGFGDFTLQARILKREVTVITAGYETVRLTIDVGSIQ